LDVLKPWKSEIYRKAFTPEKFSWQFLNLMADFSSKIRFFNSKKTFQNMGSEYSLRTDLEVSRHFYFTDFKQTRGAKKLPKTVLKTRLKTKETTYTLVFVKYLVVSFRGHSIWAFSVFFEDSLKIISGTLRARKNLKTDSDSAHQN
jgi:hypothetical protein